MGQVSCGSKPAGAAGEGAAKKENRAINSPEKQMTTQARARYKLLGLRAQGGK